MRRDDCLIELRCEELPANNLQNFAKNFNDLMDKKLNELGFDFTQSNYYVTPRRLAVIISQLVETQEESEVLRKGPAVKSAFDADNKATPACLGFARSCGVSVDDLIILKEKSGDRVGFKQVEAGKKITDVLSDVVNSALGSLSIAKKMRWGSRKIAFVRPVHSAILLYGQDVIAAEILSCKTDRITLGHSFHCNKPISIRKPADYQKILEKNFVIADFMIRRDKISKQIEVASESINGHAVMPNKLLDEVTGLVEWPVTLVGEFSANFLKVPQEILISSMEDHQKYFPVVNDNNELLPFFIVVSNIESNNAAQVVHGNERVLRARLSDAEFFYNADQKILLSSRLDFLKNMVFQKQLGSLFNKSQRIASLSAIIAKKINHNDSDAKRAGLLSKCDLTTEVVGEFPELQGVMGGHYARDEGESEDISIAIAEHYFPRFSGDRLPSTKLGAIIAIADRVDTLVGVFGVGKIPTGERDPFALRRASLGIIRLLIEKKIQLDLVDLFDQAIKSYGTLPEPDTARKAVLFVMDRLRPWYQEQGIATEIVLSVMALNLTCLADIHNRILAVQKFSRLPEASSLSVSNKRVSNILARTELPGDNFSINIDLFEHSAENDLAHALDKYRGKVLQHSSAGRYTEALSELVALRAPIDDFFDNVMVMTDDLSRRNNRLQMLQELRALFLHVADIALLQ